MGKAIKRVDPPYPALAKAARVTGTVVVQVTVDEAGNVISSSALSGHPLLRDAAVQAARGWKFSPTMISGQPVKVVGTLMFNFSI
jgi:protein TonB